MGPIPYFPLCFLYTTHMDRNSSSMSFRGQILWYRLQNLTNVKSSFSIVSFFSTGQTQLRQALVHHLLRFSGSKCARHHLDRHASFGIHKETQPHPTRNGRIQISQLFMEQSTKLTQNYTTKRTAYDYIYFLLHYNESKSEIQYAKLKHCKQFVVGKGLITIRLAGLDQQTYHKEVKESRQQFCTLYGILIHQSKILTLHMRNLYQNKFKKVYRGKKNNFICFLIQNRLLRSTIMYIFCVT